MNYTDVLESNQAKVSLEVWMQRYQAGEGDALEALVKEVSPRLKVIFRGGSPESEIEELVQETWFQVHRSRHTWRPGEMLLPWVYSIARHIRSQSYRKRTRRAEVELDEKNIHTYTGTFLRLRAIAQ
jgi:RNA polymerase sigma-70 factor (ECF subfamily)